MYGLYKGDMLTVSCDMGRKLNLTVPFLTCFGPGDAKLAHYAMLTSKHNYDIVHWFRVFSFSLKGNTMVFPFLPRAPYVKVILFRLLAWMCKRPLAHFLGVLSSSSFQELLIHSLVHVMIAVAIDWAWALTLGRALAYLLEQRIERHHLRIYTSSFDIFRFC